MTLRPERLFQASAVVKYFRAPIRLGVVRRAAGAKVCTREGVPRGSPRVKNLGRGCASDVEAEVDYVAFLHDVFFAFEAEDALLAGGCV